MPDSRNCLLFTFDENYVWPGLVAIHSGLRQSPSGVDVVVASIGLSAESHSKIQEICAKHDRRVDIVEAGRLVEGLPEGLPRFSPAAWSRVFLDRLIPEYVERLVYLDGDTYSRRSLTPLFEMDLAGMVLAAVPDPWEPHHQARGPEFWRAAGSSPSSAYFNSGVMVVDMITWRREQITRRVVDVVAAGAVPTRSVDQDALNAVLWNQWIPLDREWNLPGSSRWHEAARAHVVHFVGDSKPWNVRSQIGAFQREYQSIAKEVGWDFQARLNSPIKSLVRSIVPVWMLERFRWWRARRSES